MKIYKYINFTQNETQKILLCPLIFIHIINSFFLLLTSSTFPIIDTLLLSGLDLISGIDKMGGFLNRAISSSSTLKGGVFL